MGFVRGETLHQLLEVIAGEAPVEGLGDAAPVALEGVEGARDLGEVLEVVGLEELALHDGEVDLDLVEPARMQRQVDEDEVPPAPLEPLDRALAAVRGAVVDDPEDPARGGVWL